MFSGSNLDATAGSDPNAPVDKHQHQNIQPIEGKWQCGVCFQNFNSKKSLANHSRKHVRKESPVSHSIDVKGDNVEEGPGVPNTASSSVQQPVRHPADADTKSDTSTMSNNLQCSVCLKTYKYKGALVNHERKHFRTTVN